MKKVSLIFAAALLIFIALHPAPAATNKRIYIAPDDHTDYMWAGDEATYRAAFLEMLDYYLDQSDATDINPADAQGRWNCDCALWFKTYEENRTAAQFSRLIARLRDGHVSVPLNMIVACYGGQPAEAVLRGMFYSGSLERRFGVSLPLVAAMENQTLPYGLGALWAGAGARYSWRGICNCATKTLGAGNRANEIYWWRGLDGSRLLMKWNSTFGDSQTIGGYAEARFPSAIVNFVDTDPGFIQHWPYPVIGAFGKGWDDLKTKTDEFVTAALNQATANRRVIVSNEQDFFSDFETNHGATLPTQALAFGNEWDLYSASMSEVSASVRRAVEKLRAAEAMATLVSLKNPAFMDGRQTARDRAWADLGLYWDHDWTADGSVSRAARAAWERRLAGEIAGYVDTLHSDAAAALGAMIPAGTANTRFFVFNPLGWTRSDQADLPYSGSASVQVYEVASGQEVPAQIVTVDGQRMLRVLAGAVPPVGYKVYEIRDGSGGSSFGDAATVTGSTVENEFYRVTLDGRGAITSLVDKNAANREFVKVTSGLALNDLGSGTGTVAVESAGPVSVTLLASCASPVSHTSRVTLMRGLARVAIRNDINQNFASVLSWGFGLNLSSPDVMHEEVGAVIRARTDAAGGQYSSRCARYDWLTLNHFADMSAAGAGLTLANADCAFMQLGNSTPQTLDTATPLLRVLAGGQIDGASLGIPSQGGDTHFMQRFALATRGATFDAAAAMRFALEAQNPLVAGLARGGTGYPADSYTMLAISNPGVLLWALKPAEDGIGRGIVARVWNMAGAGAGFTLSLAQDTIADASVTTHLEVALGKATLTGGRLSDTLSEQQLKTYLILPRGQGYNRAKMEAY